MSSEAPASRETLQVKVANTNAEPMLGCQRICISAAVEFVTGTNLSSDSTEKNLSVSLSPGSTELCLTSSMASRSGSFGVSENQARP